MTDVAVLADAYNRWAPASIQNATIPSGSVSRGDSVFLAFTGENGDSGISTLTEQTATAISAISACVDLISGAVATLPMNLYQNRGNGQRQELYDDPLWWMLNEEFHPRWAASAGWEHLTRSRLFHGDAFAVIERTQNGTIRSLKPVHPRDVEVYETPEDRLVYAVFPTNQARRREVMVYDQDDMLHVPGDGFDGVRSISTLRHKLRVAGSVAAASQNFSARFFANGARPDYVLQSDGSVPEAQLNNIRETIEAAHAGVRNSHRPMLLTNGLKFEPVTMPLEDLQLIETRKFQVAEIARIFGLPPFMIGHTEGTSNWGTGIESQGIGFVRYTLRKHLHAFTNEINRKFFKTSRKFAEFDTTELERADTKSLFESFSVALNGEAFMTRNEVRRRLNLVEMPEGGTLSEGNANEQA